jgi:hypothetical protein
MVGNVFFFWAQRLKESFYNEMEASTWRSALVVALSDVAAYGRFPLQHAARMCGRRISMDT